MTRHYKCYPALLEKYPDSEVLLIDQGVLMYLLDNFTGAETSLKAAICINYNALLAYLSLGGIYASQERVAQAVAIYEQGLTVRVAESDAWMVDTIKKELTFSRQQ